MYEYKVVRIPINVWTGKPKEDYLNVIQDYAEDGYRLVQVYNPSISGYMTKYIEIIFEKPKR